MKAARIHKFGGPDVIVIDDVATPAPGAGEVLVQVSATGVGPWDALIREGGSKVSPAPPLTLGSDLSGTVKAVGPGVTEFKIGDEVYGVTNPQFLVMTMIHAYPGISGAEVARLTMLTPQTISLIVANLERDGRVRRAVSPDHGRIQPMELTEKGMALLAQCRERTSRFDAHLRAGLTPDQEAFLRQWLVEIATRDLTNDT